MWIHRCCSCRYQFRSSLFWHRTGQELHLSRCYLLHRRIILHVNIVRKGQTIILNSPEQRAGVRTTLVYLWNVFELLSRLPLSRKWRKIAANYLWINIANVVDIFTNLHFPILFLNIKLLGLLRSKLFYFIILFKDFRWFIIHEIEESYKIIHRFPSSIKLFTASLT